MKLTSCVYRNDIVTNGVIIATDRAQDENDTLTLTTIGEVWAHRSTDIMFAVPDFVQTSLTERCGADAAHASEHELAARLKVLNHARDFERAVETEQHRLARYVNDLYGRVRAESADAWGRITTLEAARICTPTPRAPIVSLFAMHKQLMARGAEYQCRPLTHWMVHRFDVRPLADLQTLQRVSAWLRKRDPCVKDFQEKAKAVIEASRRLAQDASDELPSRLPNSAQPSVLWTPTDNELIRALKLSLSLGRKIQRNPYEGLIPAIIKGTYKYEEGECGPATAFKFLQEIGVYTPWEDIASKDRELGLSQEPVDTKVPTKPLSGLIADAHDSVRHDFGKLPVFVIDDFSAEELDDGVSVERIPSEPDNVWIHVHIADPTALLPLEHEITRKARAMRQNAYFIHRSWPMLPQELSKKCDMGVGVTEAQRVLTFSAKVDATGDILDYKVRPGIVQNVQLLKYDDVDVVLGERGADHVFSPFEPAADVERTKDRDVAHVLPFAEDLKTLYDRTRQFVARRIASGALSYTLPAPELSMRPKPVPFNPADANQPILYRGFPELRYVVAGHLAHETGARSLIAECMKLACRLASRFGLDHDIPLLRRGLAPIVFASDAARERALSMRDATGSLDPFFALRERIMFGPVETTLAPAAHWGMGLPAGEGYVRATSPLRRFADMVAHWQIKSALLPARERAPFDVDAMQGMVEDLMFSDLAVKRAERAHSRWWSMLYIRRWMERQARARAEGRAVAEGAGLDARESLEATVMRPLTIDLLRKQPFVEVYVHKLGVPALMVAPSLDYGKEIGDKINVRLKEVEARDLNPSLFVQLA